MAISGRVVVLMAGMCMVCALPHSSTRVQQDSPGRLSSYRSSVGDLAAAAVAS